MKVYVENEDVIKNCWECPCCDTEYRFCNALRKNTWEDLHKLSYEKQEKWLEEHDWDIWEQHNKLKDCPIKSLSDHDKQLRKELCAMFKTRFIANCMIEEGWSLEMLNRILKEIEQGETKK